jgi:pyruvate/2-oxoglutarate dehydrogenase complex dihydrolipoamide acyltransferase (E2) component
MARDVIMPKVDMDMASGTIRAWLVEDGAEVREGAGLFEIETDKAAMEIDAPASGILRRMAEPGVALAVGSVVARIFASGENQDMTPAVPAPPPPVVAKPGTAVHAASETSADADRTPDGARATPLARRLARQRGIALSGLTGSGPRGRIQAADVIARTPSESAAPLSLKAVLNLSACTALLSRLNTGHDMKLLEAAVLVKALAVAFGLDSPAYGRLEGGNLKKSRGAGAQVARLSVLAAALAGETATSPSGILDLRDSGMADAAIPLAEGQTLSVTLCSGPSADQVLAILTTRESDTASALARFQTFLRFAADPTLMLA